MIVYIVANLFLLAADLIIFIFHDVQIHFAEYSLTLAIVIRGTVMSLTLFLMMLWKGKAEEIQDENEEFDEHRTIEKGYLRSRV